MVAGIVFLIQAKERMVAGGAPGKGFILLQLPPFQKYFHAFEGHHVRLGDRVATQILLKDV